MKKPLLFLPVLMLAAVLYTNAQVQINKQLQMTGSGTDAKITGIQSVTGTNDATNVGSIQTGNFIYTLSTGSSNSFALNITPAISAYQAGMVFNFLSNQNITGPATLNVNNLGAVTITKNINQPLAQCDIQTGQFVSAGYDGANFQILSELPYHSSPSAPTAATSVPSATQILWNWNSVPGATGYKYNTVNDYATATDNGADTSYTETGLNCGTADTLYVWAYTSPCGNSSPTTLTQTTAACCGTITLDATNQVTGSASSNSFTINTTYANEIILVCADGNGCCGGAPFDASGSIAVDALTVTDLAQINQNGSSAYMALYACVAPTPGSHTVTVSWGGWSPDFSMAYAASFTGFCSAPTVAANVQNSTAQGVTTVSASITPGAANSCLFGNYYNFTSSASTGTVTWTNDNLIRTDHVTGCCGWDGSIANTTLPGTSSVTVTASDNIPSGNNCSLILAVVHQ